MEDLVKNRCYPDEDFWRNRDVFVTGHTGFKGSWLCLWLAKMGAKVHGYSLASAAGPQGEKPLFDLSEVRTVLASHTEADIRNKTLLAQKWAESKATVLFHMAAQPLVRESYRQPYETFEVNTQGTLAVMEALRSVGRSAAAVIVTTDKVYENPEEIWGRRESDPLGGHDPYSASKAAAELVAAAYRQSFFQSTTGESAIRAATARAGNVIGGGDWAADRLVPDLARAFSAGRQAVLRNPKAVRPWQHVLEPLTGYMILAERLWQEPDNALWSSAWNFGPAPDDLWPVSHIADNFALAWGLEMSWLDVSDPLAPFESSFLHLNTDKSILKLGWKPRWKTGDAVTRSALWYKGFAAAGFKAPDACLKDIQDYLTAPQ